VGYFYNHWVTWPVTHDPVHRPFNYVFATNIWIDYACIDYACNNSECTNDSKLITMLSQWIISPDSCDQPEFDDPRDPWWSSRATVSYFTLLGTTNTKFWCGEYTTSLCTRPALTGLHKNSPGDQIANLNFLSDDIVRVLPNTTDYCINSATDRRGYVLERRFTKFREITQCNGHYAVQGHSRSPILVPIEDSHITFY